MEKWARKQHVGAAQGEAPLPGGRRPQAIKGMPPGVTVGAGPGAKGAAGRDQ